ncbi:MAG: DNA mismatch repair endonuclease MutL, partial [Oscillospiraceae bacterium]|nr:DNA mismatch repair endonuclease MutL [Oscillospiraceae bacterium]
MPVIHILSPHVADLIAAGEVVERPASVVKELVENAFDAGAKNVTVEIRGGGAPYIRVTDDGCGMAPEDAGVAFLRHATSKLHDERGLEAIGTMGFRGEALAAISAVSHVELRTRRSGDEAGTLVTLTAGDIQDMGPVGCPAGTTMIVRDLFFNTPARLKFLKSDRAEATACVQAALRCALGRPEVSVRFLRDGKEEFFSPGDGRQDSCVYTLLGRDLASSLLQCRSEEDGLRLSGFVSSPAAGRGNRSAQYFFCNGRYIRSALLQAALEQAYKNTLLTGRYPACVLYLDLGLGSVDVNVHPAKMEVKFSFEKKVFDLVYNAVRLTLDGEQRTAQVELSPATRKLAEPRADFYRSMRAEDFRTNGYSAGRGDKAHARGGDGPAPAA